MHCSILHSSYPVLWNYIHYRYQSGIFFPLSSRLSPMHWIQFYHHNDCSVSSEEGYFLQCCHLSCRVSQWQFSTLSYPFHRPLFSGNRHPWVRIHRSFLLPPLSLQKSHGGTGHFSCLHPVLQDWKTVLLNTWSISCVSHRLYFSL